MILRISSTHLSLFPVRDMRINSTHLNTFKLVEKLLQLAAMIVLNRIEYKFTLFILHFTFNTWNFEIKKLLILQQKLYGWKKATKKWLYILNNKKSLFLHWNLDKSKSSYFKTAPRLYVLEHLGLYFYELIYTFFVDQGLYILATRLFLT